MCSWQCRANECIPRCLASRLRRHKLLCADDEFQIRLDDLRASAASDARLADVQAILAAQPALRNRPSAQDNQDVSIESNLPPAAAAQQADILTRLQPSAYNHGSRSGETGACSIEQGWRTLPEDGARHSSDICMIDHAAYAREVFACPSPSGPAAQMSGSPGGKDPGLSEWQDADAASSSTAASSDRIHTEQAVDESWRSNATTIRRSTASRHPKGPQ